MTRALTAIVTQMRREIDEMPAQMQVAVKYIIDHPAEFALNSIRTTTDRIGISSNVLIRLAQRMGYDSFDAFRRPFRNALTTDGEDRFGQDWLEHLKEQGQFGAAQARFAQNEINVVARSLRLMAPQLTQQAVAHIRSARRCYVTATRSSHALAYYFHYAARMAHPGLQLVPRHMGSAIDDLVEATAEDCLFAITVHPYSADTIQAMRYARDRSMRIVLLSDSEVIAPGVEPDVVLPVSTRTLHPFSSFSGAMAVLECLLGHLFDAGGETARERVDAYQKAREDTGAYWRPGVLPKLRKP
ncbi:SIS domain-containing protein [Ruegeria atlantica]|uniref:SIS domain-containing protein n=1 Tax=Ruegeria atlantica TaxID=81569 RepID=A0AA90YYD2_9RHOB|nr:MurR/RpiR family transcriptional regulator [Ruegeria atlantica]NOE17301.1 SIS domain-containing protein [Ruegeria atlantica]